MVVTNTNSCVSNPFFVTLRCDALVLELHVNDNFSCQALHGGLEQIDRESIFDDFKNGERACCSV